jgi:hypothetical protein
MAFQLYSKQTGFPRSQTYRDLFRHASAATQPSEGQDGPGRIEQCLHDQQTGAFFGDSPPIRCRSRPPSVRSRLPWDKPSPAMRVRRSTGRRARELEVRRRRPLRHCDPPVDDHRGGAEDQAIRLRGGEAPVAPNVERHPGDEPAPPQHTWECTCKASWVARSKQECPETHIKPDVEHQVSRVRPTPPGEPRP